MTNGERLRQMTDNELGDFLCSKLADCACCFRLRECFIGHNGIATWLQKDYKGDEDDK